MAMANRRRSRSPPANRQRGCPPPPTASSLFFPPELIPEVAKRLTNLQDFFALRAACRAYRALLPLTASSLASQAPLLLVAFDRTRSHVLFRHPTLSGIHRFRLPSAAVDANGHVLTQFHPLGCRLAIYETRGVRDIRRNLSIVHLLTGERAYLSCPPDRLSRVLLYGNLVLTWKYCGRAIQYCHLEATDWRVAEICQPYLLQDLIYVNGTLYALVISHVTGGYRLAAVELSENKNLVELVFLGGHWHRPTMQDMHDMHLAECCGEMILVCTLVFGMYHVFKWKFEEAKWASITSLGGCTLFLAADNHFVGCLGPNHRGIQGDFIYAAADNPGTWCKYSLDDGSLEIVDAIHRGGETYLAALAWVFPRMC